MHKAKQYFQVIVIVKMMMTVMIIVMIMMWMTLGYRGEPVAAEPAVRGQLGAEALLRPGPS